LHPIFLQRDFPLTQQNDKNCIFWRRKVWLSKIPSQVALIFLPGNFFFRLVCKAELVLINILSLGRQKKFSTWKKKNGSKRNCYFIVLPYFFWRCKFWKFVFWMIANRNDVVYKNKLHKNSRKNIFHRNLGFTNILSFSKQNWKWKL